MCMKCGKRTTISWQNGGCDCQHKKEEECLQKGGHVFTIKDIGHLRWTECISCRIKTNIIKLK